MTNALQTLIELTQNRMDDAAKRLGELLANSNAHEERLRLLEQYRNDYDTRLRDALTTGIGPDALRNYTVFLGRLNDAISEQQRILDEARDHVTVGRQAWVDQRNRKKAFDTLADRQLQIEVKRENKAEQRMTDEHSAKLFRDKAEQGKDQ